MKRSARFKCLHCKEFHQADYRNRGRQRFCGKAECRQAAKAHSQRAWLAKAGNENYFRGKDHVRRVREWRQGHPGYWRKKKPEGAAALQEACLAQVAETKRVVETKPSSALQEAWLMQPAVLVGLISSVTGSALQEDIARSARGFFLRGRDILGLGLRESPQTSLHESETSSLSRTAAARAAPVQLD
jgi:hypothetical protein